MSAARASATRPQGDVLRRLLRGGFTARFHQLTYLMVATALFPLFVSGFLSWALFPVALGLLGLAYATDIGVLARRLGVRFWTTATSIAVVITALRALDPDTRFHAFIHLLLFLQLYRLFNPKKNREYLQVHLLAFFQLLIITALSASFSLAPMLLAFMVTTTWAFTTFQIKRGLDAEEEFRTDGPEPERAIGAPTQADPLVSTRTLLATAGVAVGTFLVTFPIFYAIPRLSTGYFLSPLVSTRRITGFDDNVELGEVGKISLDRRLAMRIELTPPDDRFKLGQPIHVRGLALDHYDGLGWSVRSIQSRTLKPENRGLPAEFRTGRARNRNDPVVTYTVYQEPLGTKALFGFYRPFQHIVGVDELERDEADSIFLPRVYGSTIKYIVQSALEAPDPAVLAAADGAFSPADEAIFLNVPERMDPRVERLAREITAGAVTPYQKAAAIERYLEQNYGYTLDLVRNDALMPLEDFLFEQKKGHCEYFATAQAVLLRTVGVPSRLVNGFLGGEWNDVGQYLIFRQSDAHSWTEVAIPGHGWIPFDPSPRPVDGAFDNVGFLAEASHAFDAARMAWNRYVLDFGYQDQRDAFLKLHRFWLMNRPRGPNPLRWFDRSLSKGGSGRRALGWTLIAACVAIAAWNLLGDRAPWRRRTAQPGDDPSAAAAGFYADMLATMARRGAHKPPAATPREYLADITSRDPEACVPVAVLTDLYERARHAGTPLDENDLTRATSALEDLAHTPRPPRNHPAAHP